MPKFRKKISSILGVSLGILSISLVAFGQQQQSSTTTSTTVQETTQVKAPATHHKAKPTTSSTAKSSVKSEDTTTSTTTTTVTQPPPPPPPKEVVHKVYDEEGLKKMTDTLCTEGFKAYVGTEKKNVCASHATAPDIAYTCVWDKKGTAAFAPTKQGPCNLDYTEHQGSVILKKEKSSAGGSPPLPYGTEAQCCYRPAKGFDSASQ